MQMYCTEKKVGDAASVSDVTLALKRVTPGDMPLSVLFQFVFYFIYELLILVFSLPLVLTSSKIIIRELVYQC